MTRADAILAQIRAASTYSILLGLYGWLQIMGGLMEPGVRAALADALDEARRRESGR